MNTYRMSSCFLTGLLFAACVLSGTVASVGYAQTKRIPAATQAQVRAQLAERQRLVIFDIERQAIAAWIDRLNIGLPFESNR